MAAKQQCCPSILMLPWLAHGHISPFLELAKKLSHKNFHIYFCSTPINLMPIRETLPSNMFSSIQLIDINLPSSQELPPHYHTTKDLPPYLMSTLKAAFDAAQPSFCNILKTLKPNLVIYDFLQPWVPKAAREQNINAIIFLSAGAACCSFFVHYANSPGEDYPFPALSFPENQLEKITQFMRGTANGLTNKERFIECLQRSSKIALIKTSKNVEAKYIDLLAALIGKEVVPVGPLIQDHVNNGHEDDDDAVVIMEWLSKKDPCSVVFVSFGSEYFLSKEEMEEIAYGLELSKVGFIWVVRLHGGEKIKVHEALPDGFQQRMGERGLVVEDWAPQAKILSHPSTGGFVSHCGWSSVLEGIMFGVPIIAVPMQLDQPINARLLVDVGVGVEVERRNERLNREEVARVINRVVLQEGAESRRKSKELSEKIREKGDEEMGQVVKELMQIVRESGYFAVSGEEGTNI
ncbi:flavanone 7-O-glucoside 2''-O-beta-L-rhamnosyltransferase-like [Malania oleifera]|uniref:flavanone 7-O-glucoside 2''-O-beta-L-rhamnosyltransferase-like n=1 Tax=Malania oleifera TaxID=397392 RepID=UPI0025AE4D08|nr:flavanone 7-O-glucoside 2''-O-beta-L-rhamnosyltransferase-like [Malania oleifera]